MPAHVPGRSSGSLSRRRFLQQSSVAGAAAMSAGVWSQLSAAETKSPNEKLNIAAIGTAAQASYDIRNCAHENIVALCDIDDNLLAKAATTYKGASKHNDFRRMLDKEHKNIDAVVIATPDHVHAVATMAAIGLGKHVYCEKPLTHSVSEARIVTEAARKAGVVSQMGTQIHAGENYRRVVEIIQSGAIGPVREAHVWVGKGWGGGELPKEKPAVPKHIHWDLWIGPAEYRAYHPTYIPFHWRRWWEFGQGTLGDMACHYMDLPFWALQLGHPTAVEAKGPPVHDQTAPLGLVVNYDFPQRDKLPPVKLTWYDGNLIPKEVAGHKVPGSGVMFVGEKGQMFANYGSYKLYPEDQYADFKPPKPSIPRSIGHHREWTEACKTGEPTTCNFDYSGVLSEAVLLGCVAYRAGERLEWNAEKLAATNTTADQQYVQHHYRKGWTL